MRGKPTKPKSLRLDEVAGRALKVLMQKHQLPASEIASMALVEMATGKAGQAPIHFRLLDPQDVMKVRADSAAHFKLWRAIRDDIYTFQPLDPDSAEHIADFLTRCDEAITQLEQIDLR